LWQFDGFQAACVDQLPGAAYELPFGSGTSPKGIRRLSGGLAILGSIGTARVLDAEAGSCKGIKLMDRVTPVAT